MILVDTSVWIDHLHRSDAQLVDLLHRDEVLSHPLVIEELALGSIGRREEILTALARLRMATTASHREIRELVDRRRLWGRGLSVVDVHLLAAVRLTSGSSLWTRDKRLRATASEQGYDVVAWR